MARRTPPRAAKSKGRRETKARSRKTAAPDRAVPGAAGEAEVVEEEKGMGVGDGMVLATTILLVVACLMTDYLLGAHYGEGLFFK